MVESEYSIILRLITLVFTSQAHCQSIVEKGIQTGIRGATDNGKS